jgi:hypothetical protein
LAVLVAAAGCGRVVPAGGEAHAATPAPRGIDEGADLLPADLDLVVRIDLGRVRRSLGLEPSRALAAQAIGRAGADEIVRRALLGARVAWLGLRVADFGAGDRVLVVEAAERGSLAPDSAAWERHVTGAAAIARYAGRRPAARDGTAEIVTLGEKTTVFVSPVEVMSVRRVLGRGPDAERGQPAASGLLSVDYRPSRPSAEIENAYPSLAALLRGIERVRATVDITGQRLDIDGTISCRNERAAERVSRFVETIQQGGSARPELGSLLGSLTVRRAERTVLVRWPLEREAVLVLLRQTRDPEAQP